MDYPSELSPSAKATIEHALAEIELACIAARDRELGTKTKTITPMQMVVRGYDVAVDVSTTDALTAAWTAETLKNVTDRLLDRIIRRIYKQHPRLGTSTNLQVACTRRCAPKRYRGPPGHDSRSQ